MSAMQASKRHVKKKKKEQKPESIPWEIGTPADVVADICKKVTRQFKVRWLKYTEEIGENDNGLIVAWHLVDATLIMKFLPEQSRYCVAEIQRKEVNTA
jgi:hypothetical protein